jgi:hypothetical protein
MPYPDKPLWKYVHGKPQLGEVFGRCSQMLSEAHLELANDRDF